MALLTGVLVTACASAPGTQSDAVLVRPAAVPSSVITVAEAPVRVAPNGKAEIRLLAKGNHAFVGMLRMDAGGKVPSHQDVSEEYIYVVSGSGTLTIDGKKTAIEPGTMIFMPAGSTVSYDNGDEPLVALQIFADPGSAKKYQAWSPKE